MADTERDRLLHHAADLATDFLDDPPRSTGRAGPSTWRALRPSLGGPMPDRRRAGRGRHRPRWRATRIPAWSPRPVRATSGSSSAAASRPSLAADWLTSAWDQNAGLFALSPAASVVEEVAAGWLVDLFGLPAGSSVGFTTGATMANFTALAAARHRVLERVGLGPRGRTA